MEQLLEILHDKVPRLKATIPLEVSKMSIAGTRIDNEPLSTNLLGDTKVQHVQQHFQQNRRSQLYPHPERNPRSVAGCAGELDFRGDRPGPPESQCQQPQKQDEAHAACTNPSQNELSY